MSDQWMMLGDDLLLTEDGAIATDPSCCCGVQCQCSIDGCIGGQKNGQIEPPGRPGLPNTFALIRAAIERGPGDPCEGPPANDPDGTHYDGPRCARLDIYECTKHDGNRFIVQSAGRTTVLTNIWTLAYSAYSGPFCGLRKCSHGHLGTVGALLNDRPFWWADCGIGGWRVVQPWWTFTDAEWVKLYNAAVTGIGAGSMPAAGEYFTLILYLQFRRRNSSCVEDSSIRLISTHLTC